MDSSCGSIQHQKQLAPDLQSYFAKSNWNEIEKLWRPDIKIASREYLYSTMSSPVANRKYTSLKPLSGRPAASSWTLGSASASCDDASAAFNILTVMNSVSSGSDQLNGDGDVKSHNFPRNISSFCTGSSIGSASNAFHDRIDNYDLSYKHTPNPKDNMKEYAELEGISLADFHIHNNHTRKSRLASRQGSAIGTAIHHRRAQLEPQTQLAPVSSIACSIQSATDINGSSEQDYNLQIVNPNDTPNLLLDHSLTIQASMTSSPGASKRAERDAFIRSSQSGFQKILSTMLPQFDKVLFNRLESELDSKQVHQTRS